MMNSKNNLKKMSSINMKQSAKENSPRLQELSNHLKQWLNEYSDEEFKDPEQGIDLIILGVDNKYKTGFKFLLGQESDTIGSALNAFNYGIGNFLIPDKENLNVDIFNGVSEYFARLFAQYPNYWKQFQGFVEHYKKEKDE